MRITSDGGGIKREKCVYRGEIKWKNIGIDMGDEKGKINKGFSLPDTPETPSHFHLQHIRSTKT